MDFKTALSIFFYLYEARHYAKESIVETDINTTFHDFCLKASTELEYPGFVLFSTVNQTYPRVKFSGRSVKDGFKKNTTRFFITKHLTRQDIINHNLPQVAYDEEAQHGSFPLFGGTVTLRSRLNIDAWEEHIQGHQYIIIECEKIKLDQNLGQDAMSLLGEIQKIILT